MFQHEAERLVEKLNDEEKGDIEFQLGPEELDYFFKDKEEVGSIQPMKKPRDLT